MCVWYLTVMQDCLSKRILLEEKRLLLKRQALPELLSVYANVYNT